jgi:tryptophan-rich sensory protein
MTLARARRFKAVLAAAGAALALGILGALATDLSPWYYQLRQPPWKPPDWLFGPVWTLIYALAAVAGIRAWERSSGVADRDWLLVCFSLNAFLNLLWSLFFFRLQRPDWALAEVVLLWISVALLVIVAGRISKAAGALLLPYLAWVAFAGALNFEVVRLNGPFAP